jgi:hypothetical protein
MLLLKPFVSLVVTGHSNASHQFKKSSLGAIPPLLKIDALSFKRIHNIFTFYFGGIKRH